MRKLKKGDEIIVIAGRDKGKRSTVSKVLDNDKLVIENLNMVKKHQRGNPNAGIPSSIIDMEAPIHVSNVAILNGETGRADRVGFKLLEDGNKVRIFKSSGKQIDTDRVG